MIKYILKNMLNENVDCSKDIEEFFNKLKVKEIILIPEYANIIGLSNLTFNSAKKIRKNYEYIIDECGVYSIEVGQKLNQLEMEDLNIDVDTEYKSYVTLNFDTVEAYEKISDKLN